MRRLSSPSTFFYKRVFPVLWLAFVAVFMAIMLFGADLRRQDIWPFLCLPLLMSGTFGFLFWKLISDLVDEVWLDGASLLVKNRDEQARIDLSQVMNVNATEMVNPRRVTVMLRGDSRFGRNITFIPASPRGFFTAFKMDPIAADLIEKVDAARRRQP
ncbi:hypothetical protein [Dyella subtropica]|uniref:hypothetical protein n=1 Tax=Dyella subtropica TaxID=2992127 RepID=UPI00225C377F|nr:hypothetical protein [Dyella subtropica]